MTKFPKFADISSMASIEAINEEIFLFERFLFDLKITLGNKKSNLDEEKKVSDMVFRNSKKPHYFIFIKRRLVHLKYQRSLLLKQQQRN